MPRHCGWCTDNDRGQLEQRVFDGEPFRAVALATPYSESAAARHFRNHVTAPMLDRARLDVASGPHIADFTARMVELLDETAAVRAVAAEVNDGTLMLKAVAQERDTLLALMTRLGVDDTQTAKALNEARVLAMAVHAVLQDRHPGAARQLAIFCREHGEPDLADAFDSLAVGSEPARTPNSEWENSYAASS